MMGNVLAIMCAAILSAIVSTREPALGGVTPGPTASPTPTEEIHGVRCGDGILVRQFEQCDDGNLYGGDGCAPDCTIETSSTVTFEPFREVTEDGGVRPVTGRLTFASAENGSAVVREFDTDPVGAQGILCFRALVPPGEPFGPGNLGIRTFGLVGSSSINLFSTNLLLLRWFNPIDGFRVDIGRDGIPCTDDDPGFADATQESRQLNLALRLDSCGGDINRDGTVMIEELVTAVHNALGGCPSP